MKKSKLKITQYDMILKQITNARGGFKPLQTDLAEACGVGKSTVSMWRASGRIPDKKVMLLCKKYDIRIFNSL